MILGSGDWDAWVDRDLLHPVVCGALPWEEETQQVCRPLSWKALELLCPKTVRVSRLLLGTRVVQ